VDEEAVNRFFVEMYLSTHPEEPEQVILDLDATDDPIHGEQEGRFFHGYYKNYCYLPLYIFSDDGFPLCARLRSSNIDAAQGVVEEVKRIVSEIRKQWPEVSILIRADSGFAREELMGWCEENQVDYIFGLAKNERLKRAIQDALDQAAEEFAQTQEPTRYFQEFSYRTLKSWSCSRRVIGKAEHLAKGSNPRFIVTSLEKESYPPRFLYEQIYCARGEMENRIKEQQPALFADRTSCSKMKANQLRLWFSTVAYLLLHLLRRMGLKGTRWARAQCDTIRLKLLSSAYPYQKIFLEVYKNLQRAGP